MPIINYNVSWMIYNCILALLAVGLGYLSLTIKNIFIKIIFFVAWLLFLPNTIYIFTDLEHLIYQWKYVLFPLRLLLILQYILLEIAGVITFLLAFIPFERAIHKSKKFRSRKTLLLIMFNFLIAFGMVLGRVERINSWQVLTSPIEVINSAINIFETVDLLGLTILFGLLCNFIYFLFNDPFIKFTKKYIKLLD